MLFLLSHSWASLPQNKPNICVGFQLVEDAPRCFVFILRIGRGGITSPSLQVWELMSTHGASNSKVASPRPPSSPSSGRTSGVGESQSLEASGLWGGTFQRSLGFREEAVLEQHLHQSPGCGPTHPEALCGHRAISDSCPDMPALPQEAPS